MERAGLTTLAHATGCAEVRAGFHFLCDPNWGANERATVEQLLARAPEGAEPARGWLCIATGGSSGAIKFARHDEETLTAAARGFCTHFGLQRVDALDVLPAYHVSGFMARVRCAETGGTHLPWAWPRLEAGDWPDLAPGRDWLISLVPTQLQRLLASPEAVMRLRDFAVIFLGGGPIWRELSDQAAAEGLRISLSYGMTETAAMVAALQPEEFLAGARSAGRVLPHAQVSIGADGTISVGGASLFRGYYPGWRAPEPFGTADVGRMDEHGQIHVLGRRDAVIITGGEKVLPAEVEAALRATGQFTDVGVIGMPDAQWGEAVVACYPADEANPNLAAVRAKLVGALAAFKRPKRYVALPEWPRNAQGKLNRARLAELARAAAARSG